MKDLRVQGYTLTGKRWKIRFADVRKLLDATYWAKDRSDRVVKRSLRHSACFAVLDARGRAVGFCRVVTDFATMYYLADVVLDETVRGNGLGLAMIRYALSDERFCHARGMLITRTAHGLYEKVGFARFGERFMMREPDESVVQRNA